MAEMKYLRRITLATELDKKVAFATVQIGDITIRGITVWRSAHGKLRVFFPSHWSAHSHDESVELPAELRSEIEAEVIAAYRESKKEAEEKANELHR
jgi:hypothetical protein